MVRNNQKEDREEKEERSLRRRKQEPEPWFDLHPRTRQWVIGVAIGTVSIFLVLSFFNQAGPAGRMVEKALFSLFGWGAFLTPFLAAAVALILFATQRRATRSSIFGSLLILLALLGLLAVLGGEDARRGGFVGHIVSLPLANIFGNVATNLTFLAVGLVGIFILLNYPGGTVPELDEEEPLKKRNALGRGNPFFNAIAAITGALPRGIAKIGESANFKVKSLEKPLALAERDDESSGMRNRTLLPTGSEDAPKKSSVPILYTPPSPALFDEDKGKPAAGDIRANMVIIKRTLANFGIEVEMGEATVGPTVTQYTLKPAEGVKLSQITTLSNDLALALAAHPIRIEAPIPGRSLVGIEVPNKQVTLVRLRNLLEEDTLQTSPYRLTFALGRDVAGSPVFAALEKMPHLLIAGATGTGKTIALNAILMSLLSRNPPSILRLLLIDPKRVEFPVYNGIPHLLTPVIVDIEKTVNALRWAVGEMERRFDVLAEAKVRDIGLYNRELERGEEPMPYIVVIIDELADLMAARGREVEAAIVRLAQMARAVGIHLVVATQRPSVEVITGLIKANITSRMAFQVASQVDSRTIVDAAGADKLLGNGDMLFMSAEASKPRRLQGAYVSEKEVRRVTDFLKKEGEEPVYQEGVTEPNAGVEGEWWEEGNGSFAGFDPLYEEAKRLVIQSRKASASYLQRRLRVGYARAARLIDLLEEHGVVGPGDGAKPRDVLIGLSSEDGSPPDRRAGAYGRKGESKNEFEDEER